jgi:hypothetical protein
VEGVCPNTGRSLVIWRELMKTTAGIFTMCAILIPGQGCSSPPPPSPESIPAPPPAYGQDPFQTGSSAATGMTGSGVLSSGVYTAPQPMSEEEAKSYIQNALESRSAQLAKGFDEEGEIASEKVNAGEEKHFAVMASKGRCMRLIAVADAGIPKLDMYLYDGKKLLDRDIGMDNYPVVSSCFKKDKEVMLVLKVGAGTGWFVVRVYSKEDDGTVKKTMDAVEKAGTQ